LNAVRCCSDTYKPHPWNKNAGCDVWAESEVDGRCYPAETWLSAYEKCASQGARLCTEAEIEAECTKHTGCGFDAKYVWTSQFTTSPPTSSPTISVSPTVPVTTPPTSSHAVVVCGATHGEPVCGSSSKVVEVQSSLNAVRCCSDTYKPHPWNKNAGCDVWAESEVDGRCYPAETWLSAYEKCASQGARLCTEAEIEAECTKHTGCGFDAKYVWTAFSA